MLAEVEGARVTSDSGFSPYGTRNQYHASEATTDSSLRTTAEQTDLKKAVIWSEILNNPKFKEF